MALHKMQLDGSAVLWPIGDMTVGHLTIDLDAVRANYRALDAASAGSVETAAVVKADGYGLGAANVSAALAQDGVRSFFVAATEEAAAVRSEVGEAADIYVFSGAAPEDYGQTTALGLIPLLNSPEQVKGFLDTCPGAPFGIQLDTGMNRLGLEPNEFAALRDKIIAARPRLIMSHLACADTPEHPLNAEQQSSFRQMTDGLDVRRSLAATGGTVMGSNYHFDLCRPGVGLWGGMPFAKAQPVAHLSLPILQTRRVQPLEGVGYGKSWIAKRPSVIASLAAGYADGVIRAISNTGLPLWAGDTPCPLVGRVSMDIVTVDITDLNEVPDRLCLLNPRQTVDTLADAAGTIGYEILTSLGARYHRTYTGG